MKKFFAVQALIHWIVREISLDIAVTRTHRERDRVMRDIVNEILQRWQRIVDTPEDKLQDMDDIPF